MLNEKVQRPPQALALVMVPFMKKNCLNDSELWAYAYVKAHEMQCFGYGGVTCDYTDRALV